MAIEFYAYAVGIISASVCTSLSDEEATIQLNKTHPTGIMSQWEISQDKTFHTGQASRIPRPIATSSSPAEMITMPDNSSFSVDPTRSGGTYSFFHIPEGETPVIRFLDGIDSVALRGIGNFEVETVDLAGDDRLDLNNLIAENRQRVRQENPWMTFDDISDIMNFRHHLDDQPVFTREMLDAIISRFTSSRPTGVHPGGVHDGHRPGRAGLLAERIAAGEEDEPCDPDAEFTPRQERHFASAKERLDDWLTRADQVLEECLPPEHDHWEWEVEAHRHTPDDPDDPECHLYRL